MSLPCSFGYSGSPIPHGSYFGSQKPSSPVPMLSILQLPTTCQYSGTRCGGNYQCSPNSIQVTYTNISLAKSSQMATSNLKGRQESIILPYARKEESWKYLNSTIDNSSNTSDELAPLCPIPSCL